MLGIEPRALRAAWTVFLFVLAIALLYLVGHTLVVFALALFLAHLLAPAVDRVAAWLPDRYPRTVALSIVYVVAIGIAVAVIIPVGAAAGEQAAALAGGLPAALQDDPLARLPLPVWLEDLRPRLTETLREQLEGLDETVVPALRRIGQGILSGLGNVLAVVLIPILSFFILKDGPELHRMIVEAAPGDRQAVVEDILLDLHQLLAQYMRALAVLAAFVFVAYGLFLMLAGVPYAVLLASVAGVLEFVPVVGPLVGSITILLVAGLSGYSNLLVIVIFLIVFRLFQDYVINPQLMSAGVAIHPLLVLFGVLAGEQVAGIPGMFFSVPVMAALRIVVRRLQRKRQTAPVEVPDAT